MLSFLFDTIVLIGQAVSLLALLYGVWLVHGGTLLGLFSPPAPTRGHQQPVNPAATRRAA